MIRTHSLKRERRLAFSKNGEGRKAVHWERHSTWGRLASMQCSRHSTPPPPGMAGPFILDRS
jgi:hypothetical protein